MDYIFSTFKFLITILSSSNIHLLELSYLSVLKQLYHPINYNIIIIINSTDTTYFTEVKKYFLNKNYDVEIIQTISNGKPGMGHNSCIQLFQNRKQYHYLIHLDGDDFLYPYAFHQLYKSFQSTKINNNYPDLLVLQGNDLITSYNKSDSTTDIYINNNLYLIKQDEYPQNKWLFHNDIININPFNNSSFITPIRPFLYSRNIFKLNIFFLHFLLDSVYQIILI